MEEELTHGTVKRRLRRLPAFLSPVNNSPAMREIIHRTSHVSVRVNEGGFFESFMEMPLAEEIRSFPWKKRERD